MDSKDNLDFIISINSRLATLEERTKALAEIRSDIKSLRLKLEAQSVKQAATAATVAILVSLGFSLLKGPSADYSRTPEVPQLPRKPSLSIKRADYQRGYYK